VVAQIGGRLRPDGIQNSCGCSLYVSRALDHEMMSSFPHVEHAKWNRGVASCSRWWSQPENGIGDHADVTSVTIDRDGCHSQVVMRSSVLMRYGRRKALGALPQMGAKVEKALVMDLRGISAHEISRR
jgi:hypothetical protein